MRTRTVASAAAVLLSAVAAAAARAQTVVSSFPDATSPYGVNAIAPYQAFGQTFTVPAGGDNILDSIRIRADVNGNTGGNVRVYVFAMSGSQTVGAPLFRSDALVDPALPFGTYTDFDFTGIGAAVTPGASYALLFSNVESNVSFAMNNTAWATTPSAAAASPYLGSLVGAGFGGPGLAQLTGATLNLSAGVAPRDLIVELTFIPSPGAAAALAFGAIAAGMRPRR